MFEKNPKPNHAKGKSTRAGLSKAVHPVLEKAWYILITYTQYDKDGYDYQKHRIHVS